MAEAMEPLVLDVREELRGGGRPMGRIMQVVKGLAPGQDLVLRATFEPIPLYAVLALRGFRHRSSRIDGGDWEIRFSRAGARGGAAGKSVLDPQRGVVGQGAGEAPASADGGEVPAETPERPWVRLDNRGLEPPEPMMRTLQALNGLPPDGVLEIHNDRRPMFLYPHLAERGYAYRTVDASDSSAFVRIWKVSDPGRAAGG